MAKKLKNLNITKVDFVDAGANPEAHVKLYKRNGETSSEEPIEEVPETLLKRITDYIGKALGIHSERIEKRGDAESFGEKMDEVKRRKIADEMWDLCFALHSSLMSILNDEEMDSAAASDMMQKSVEEFDEYIATAINSWSLGKSTGVMKKGNVATELDTEVLEHIRENLDKSIQKAKESKEQIQKLKGDLGEMIKIDKSKMSSEEVAAYEEIIKKYGVDTEDIEDGKGDGAKEDPVAKTAHAIPQGTVSLTEEPQNPVDEDIYKGLHPAVATELKMLRKRSDEAEEKELFDIAKKYELIGKKPEELVPTLKSLKAAGGTAYNDMIGVLDSALEMAEQSGAFSEIGKSGGHGGAEPDAWGKIEKKADEIMKASPNITRSHAITKACEQNPALLREYEESL